MAEFFVIAGCWLASGGGKFLFSGETKSRTWFYARVGGSVKQSGASSFLGVSASVFVFWF